PPFVPIDKEMMDCPAWRNASCGARVLYMHLKRRWSFKQRNNGRIYLSGRDAEEEIGCGRDSIERWYRELQHYGFIVMTDPGGLGVEGKGKAPHFRLTEAEWPGGRNGNTWMLPTKDYLKWDGTPFQDDRGAVSRARKRKQKPGMQMHPKVGGKCTPGPGRKCTPLHPGSGVQMHPISNTPGGVQMHPISRVTTMIAPSNAVRVLPSRATRGSIGVSRRPWHTPTVTEVPIESLPTELRMMALGLPVPEPNWQVVLEGGAATNADGIWAGRFAVLKRGGTPHPRRGMRRRRPRARDRAGCVDVASARTTRPVREQEARC